MKSGDDRESAQVDALGRGRFIVFEGLDGAGTSTQLSMTAQWLRSYDVSVETTKEPSNGPFGAALRQAIEGRVQLDPVAMALGFAADRRDHVANDFNGIEKNLDGGSWVLCDRYLFSSLAYQVGDDVTEDWIREINRFIVEPDATIFIDTPPDLCGERISTRSINFELFHHPEHLTRSLVNYQRLISAGHLIGRLFVVDGTGSVEEVFSRIASRLSDWLLGSKSGANVRRPA